MPPPRFLPLGVLLFSCRMFLGAAEPPLCRPDYVRAFSDETVAIAILANDTLPRRFEEARGDKVKVTAKPFGLFSIQADPQAPGGVVLYASVPRAFQTTYTYTVEMDGQTSNGADVTVDYLADGVLARDDTVRLGPSGYSSVRVLANDQKLAGTGPLSIVLGHTDSFWGFDKVTLSTDGQEVAISAGKLSMADEFRYAAVADHYYTGVATVTVTAPGGIGLGFGGLARMARVSGHSAPTFAGGSVQILDRSGTMPQMGTVLEENAQTVPTHGLYLPQDTQLEVKLPFPVTSLEIRTHLFNLWGAGPAIQRLVLMQGPRVRKVIDRPVYSHDGAAMGIGVYDEAPFDRVRFHVQCDDNAPFEPVVVDFIAAKARGPTAVPDRVMVNPGGNVRLDILANDALPVKTIYSVNFRAGQLEGAEFVSDLSAVGGMALTWSAPRAPGERSGSYHLDSPTGVSNEATVTVVVADWKPYVQPDTFVVPNEGEVALSPLANDLMAPSTSPPHVVYAPRNLVKRMSDDRFLFDGYDGFIADQGNYWIATSTSAAAGAQFTLIGESSVAAEFSSLLQLSDYAPARSPDFHVKAIHSETGESVTAPVVVTDRAIAGARAASIAKGTALELDLQYAPRTLYLRGAIAGVQAGESASVRTRTFNENGLIHESFDGFVQKDQNVGIRVPVNSEARRIVCDISPSSSPKATLLVSLVAVQQKSSAAFADEAKVVPGRILRLPILANDWWYDGTTVNLNPGEMVGARIEDDATASHGKMLVWEPDLDAGGDYHATYTLTYGRVTTKPQTITAHVQRDPLAPGSHAGIIRDAEKQPSAADTGVIRFDTTAGGMVSGVIDWKGVAYRFRGSLDPVGHLATEATSAGRHPKTLHVELDTFGHEEGFAGFIADESETVALTGNPVGPPKVGRVTGSMYVEPSFAGGYGLGRIDSGGRARVGIRLPMGWPLLVGGVPDQHGLIAIRKTVAHVRGKPVILAGWLQVSEPAEYSTEWFPVTFSPSALTPRDRNGQETILWESFSTFRPPAPGHSTLTWFGHPPKGGLFFRGLAGNSVTAMSVRFDAADRLILPPGGTPLVLRFSVDRQTGRFQGTFMTRSLGFRSFQGALVQPDRGMGQFQGASRVGTISLLP